MTIPFNKPFIAGKELYYMAQSVAYGNIAADGHFTRACSEFLSERFGIAKALLVPSCTAALRGDAEETYALGQNLLENLPDDAYRYPDFALTTAVFYVNVGLLDEALDLVVETSANYTFEQELIFDQMPVFAPLRDNPRFRAMVESVEVF